MGKSILAIAVGAGLGAWLRWALGLKLNAVYPAIPPGTVAANLVGAYVIGAAMALFSAVPGIPPEWRLFVITGFCGGLTTFSTFSAELVTLLQSGRALTACGAVAVHLFGSVAMTFLGMASVAWLRR